MNGPSSRQVLTALLLAIVLSLVGAFALSAGQAPAATLARTPVPLPIAAQPPTPTVAPSATPTPSPSATPAPRPGNAALQATATPPPSPTPTLTATPIPPPTPVPIGVPARLKIPAIKVDTAVEHVALDADGVMETPQDYASVAWYRLGSKPGEVGNAAISGHVDSKRGAAVFWDLRKLKPGDEVYVVGSDGVERRFVVTNMEFYKRPNEPLERIFGPAPAAHLNLFTCAGIFDRASQAYDSVLVVYTELAP